MFTGIIEETGKIESIITGTEKYKLRVKCDKVLGKSGEEMKTAIGDSIAVNGICLTVTELTDDSFTADVMPETIKRTGLSAATPGCPVNLERAMPAYGRFGGHIVSGHIDGTGKITECVKDSNAWWFRIRADHSIMKLIAEKGSIAIDGISLTVAKADHDTFSVSIIPHTMENTTLIDKKPGDTVNLETDVIAKYIERLMLESDDKGQRSAESTIDLLELI